MDTCNSQVKQRHFCQICTKGFDYSSYLRGHEIIQTGELPFVCQICDKGFSMKSSLKVHDLIHTGERRFICHVCDKRCT